LQSAAGGALHSLQRLKVRRLLALRTRFHVEGNALVFLQRLEAFRANLRKVGKQIVATGIRSGEAKAFGIVEPFDD
jgi:hypothetical protein